MAAKCGILTVAMLERVQRRGCLLELWQSVEPITLSFGSLFKRAIMANFTIASTILTLYDILHKRYPLHFSHYYTLSEASTRKHALALLPTQSSINAYQYSFLLTLPFCGTLFHLTYYHYKLLKNSATPSNRIFFVTVFSILCVLFLTMYVVCCIRIIDRSALYYV